MVMESDASSLSVVHLMIWFSYHKGIQMWGISAENKGFTVLCALQIECVRLERQISKFDNEWPNLIKRNHTDVNDCK